jgi:hypothetical protein
MKAAIVTVPAMSHGFTGLFLAKMPSGGENGLVHRLGVVLTIAFASG